MPVIVVVNPKGGVGKSTLATQIAGYLAHRVAEGRVMLGDIDRQQSARQWLALRPATLPVIHGWDVKGDNVVKPPKGTTHVVIDTPAGIGAHRLDDVMKIADKMLIPLQPSLFDIQATYAFVSALNDHKRADRVQMALVGMRVKEHTISNDQLHQFLAQLNLPVLAYLRDTQNYVHLSARGLTLWDVAPGRVERDLEQWRPIVEWIMQ